MEFQLQNLMDLTDITLVAEDEEELFAHKSILVARFVLKIFLGLILTEFWINLIPVAPIPPL